jgi:hypothetical protein
MYISMITRILLLVCVFILLSCSSVAAQLSPKVAHIETYTPSVKYVGRDPSIPLNSPSKPGSEVHIYAQVNDKYGKIEQATLSFNTTKGYEPQEIPIPHWTNKTMQLIDGSRSNGTYAATIPSQTKNTTVFYLVHFKDDLNYTTTNAGGQFYVADLKVINVLPLLSNPVVISALIVDYGELRNVTLRYAITKGPIYPTRLISHEMSFTYSGYLGDRSQPQIYVAKIPTNGKNMDDSYLWFKVTSSDGKGNTDSSGLERRSFSPDSYGLGRATSHTLNIILVHNLVSNLDVSDRTAKTEILVKGRNIETSLFLPEIANGLTRTVTRQQFLFPKYEVPAVPVPFVISNLDNGTDKVISIKRAPRKVMKAKQVLATFLTQTKISLFR